MRVRAMLVSLAGLLLLAGSAVALGQGVSSPPAARFRITGTVDRTLAPAVSGAVNLHLGNPNGYPIRVTALRVRIAGTSIPACATGNYVVRQYGGTYPIVVPAHGSRTLKGLGTARVLWPRVGMVDLHVNQDVCRRATLTLTLTGSATRGDR